MSEQRIKQLVREAEQLSYSLAQVAIYDEAVTLADELGDDALAYDLRTDLMQSAVFSGAAEKLLTAFSWCLGKTDQNPDAFPEINLLWQYKWAISNSYRFPQIALEQTRAMLDDFELRLKRNNLSLRPAAYLRMSFSSAVGQLEEAAAYEKEWPLLKRDYFADCEACELDNHVGVLVTLERDELAIETAQRVLTGGLSCAEVPQRTYGKVITAAIRLGKDELAAGYQRAGLPLIVGNTDYLPQHAKHAVYAARVGDEAGALSIIERGLPWAMDTLVARDRMQFFEGALAALRAGDSEQVTLRLPSTHPHYQGSSRQYGRRVLDAWFDEQLRELCGQFDKRNGNDFQTREAEKMLALAKA